MFGIGRSKKIVGIDMGISCIRMVEIEKKKTLVLNNYGEMDMREVRTNSKGTVDFSNADLAEVIKAICKEAEIGAAEANFSIPDFSSFFVSFKIPAMRKEEIAETVRYEVRPYIPLPFSDITLDWIVTEGEPAKTPLKILAVAIPNKVISQYQDIANLAKLKLKSLEPEVFASVRSLVRLKPGEKKSLIGLIDIGAESTTCSIADGEAIKASHSFNIAGEQFTDRLARSLNISYNKAEELKKKYGLLEKEKPIKKGKSVREILIPIADLVLDEVKKVFREFYQEEGKEVEKIVITGGLSSMPGLKEYFFNEFKREILIPNPFSGISYPKILDSILNERGTSYSVAVGLAIKGLEK